MTYIDTILTGFLVFPLVAVVITFPYALYQYYQYGSVSKYRTLIVYSFVLYMLVAFFLVALPLPSRESTVGNRWQDHLNLIPCKQIWLYWRNRPVNLKTIHDYLYSFSLWQLLFNILLTVPFGVYLRYYFKQSFRRTVLYSFLLSLFFETSQLTALFGIYPGPYRLADVEDLICNTMGGAVGYQIAYVFVAILPKREQIDAESIAQGRYISGPRRIWSAFFDYVCSYLLFLFIDGAVTLLIPEAAKYEEVGWARIWTVFCIVSLLQVLLTKGATLGHTICHMILVSEDVGIPTAAQLFKRYLFLWLFIELPVIAAEWLTSGQFEFINDYIALGIDLISGAYFYLYLARQVFRRVAKPMPHDKLSRTTYAAIRVDADK